MGSGFDSLESQQQKSSEIPSLHVGIFADPNDHTPCSPQVVDLYNAVKPGIVMLTSELGTGTGFFATADGRIATNKHVIDGVQRLTIVTSDDKLYDGKVAAVDPDSDLAIVTTSRTRRNQPFHALPLNQSLDGLKRSLVLGMGHPFGWENIFLSPGMIEDIKPFKEIHPSKYQWLSPASTMMFNTMHVEPGNSGSPIFNMRGEVVAVIEGSAPDRSLSIPASRVLELLKKTKPEEPVLLDEGWLDIDQHMTGNEPKPVLQDQGWEKIIEQAIETEPKPVLPNVKIVNPDGSDH